MPEANPAQNYEKFFVPAIGAPVASDLIHRAALRPGESILDVACGTGIVARMAANAIGDRGKVVGLDINPAMLAVARSVTPPEIPVEWIEASAESMPLDDSSFDVVLCQMGLQFMPDKRAALSEMARILVRGGRLVLTVPGPTPELMATMENALARHVGAEAAEFVSLVFSLHETHEIQDLVNSAGFRDVSLQADTISLPLPPPEDFLRGYIQSTPLIGAMANTDDASRRALEHDIVTGWGKFVHDDTLMLRLRMVTVQALK